MKREKTKKFLLNWRTISIGFIIAIIVVLSTIAGNTTSLYVNGKDITKSGEPVYRGGVLYLPVESIVTGMGDTFTWATKPQVANLRISDGKKIMITVGKSIVYVDGKAVAVSVLELEGTKIPNQASPIVLNNKIYAPHDFFKTVLNYPVEVKKDGKKEVIYVGSTNVSPNPTPTPKPTTEPTNPVKEDARYPFPDGWTPPQMTSTWSSDKQKNMEALENELEFKNLGAGASFSPYGQGAVGTSAILLSATDTDQYDTMITLKYWMGSSYTPLGHKVPYITKELFNFYLPKEGDKLWNILDDAYNGVKGYGEYFDKIMTFEKREVKIMAVKESVVIIIGKPGLKYDSDWKVIK